MMDTQEHYRKKDSQQITQQHLEISRLRNENKQLRASVKSLYKERNQLKRELRK